MIAFWVPGIPAPQGSMRAFMPRGSRLPVVTGDNPKTKPWRASVAYCAMQARGKRPLYQGPVMLQASFYLPRPKSLPKKVVDAIKKPDLDKLVRGVCDALKGVVWEDDSQVTSIVAIKNYGTPGCHVEVRGMGKEEWQHGESDEVGLRP